jgi:hypothetical protein
MDDPSEARSKLKMRTIDTVYDHNLLWRVEWRDADGFVVQVSVMNEEAFDYMMEKRIEDVIREAGESAVSVIWDTI